MNISFTDENLFCSPINWSVSLIKGTSSAHHSRSDETHHKCTEIFWRIIGLVALLPSAALFLFIGLPVKLISNWSSSSVVIAPEKILEYLKENFSLEKAAARQAFSRIHIVQGSILRAKGVIQDPAGSAVGTNKKPAGGGLSGAIYKGFVLDPIPQIGEGASVFNTNCKRILHTHSPNLERVRLLKEAVCKIKDGYLSAITLFVEKQKKHKKKRLNLCAISSQLYGGRFARNSLRHIDPSITQTALCAAIGEYLSKNPGGLDKVNIYLFYLPGRAGQKAEEIKNYLSLTEVLVR